MGEVQTPRAPMEAGGAYNRYARLQASGGALALPFLENAVLKMPLSNGAEPLVIADYGSSQGKNSFAPLKTAIRSLRMRTNDHRPIVVVHVDQPTNDFNELFRALDNDPDSYVRGIDEIFPVAIGRSFYECILPPEQVDLAWSSYAAQWLRRVPTVIPDHFFPRRSTGAVFAAFERQAAQDWELFLALRARELRPGGCLVVVLPAITDDGSFPFFRIFDEANEAVAEMVADGVITVEERAQMVLGTYPRQRRDLLAPFTKEGCFEGLTVQCCEISELVDLGWKQFELSGDAEEWASGHALFFRSTFVPSLASVLRSDRDQSARSAFANNLVTRLRQRLAQNPSPLHAFVQTLVIAKAT